MVSPVENSDISGMSGSRSEGRSPLKKESQSLSDLYLRASSSFWRNFRRNRIGISDMVSVPPANTISACPERIKSTAEVVAWLEEMQAWVTVWAGMDRGRPALSADSRATLLV